MNDRSRSIEAFLHELDTRGDLFDSFVQITSPYGGPANIKATVRDWDFPFGFSVMTAMLASVARRNNHILNVTFENCRFVGQDDLKLLTRIVGPR